MTSSRWTASNRVDTLDLQDQTSPSAKDHSKPPAYTPEGLGPHQERTIRHADRDSKTEMLNGPIVDEKDDHDRDEINMYDGPGHMNGDNDLRDESGGDSDDGDLVDGDADDLLDDDLMDKISSSPSIDDGASHTQPLDLANSSRGYRFRVCVCAPQFRRNGRRTGQCFQGRYHGTPGR